MDIRQVGTKRENFAPNAKIIRADIDPNELEYKVHDNEMDIVCNANEFLNHIINIWPARDYTRWINVCERIRAELFGHDDKKYNKLVRKISEYIPQNSIITTDVGQNQVWVAQSFDVKKGQRILFSGGHGAMGYSLPASMGATLASHGIVYSFNGDGGIQMNIQELQMIAREQLPIKIILFNNDALGMIRHFQEMYFNDNYFQTTPDGGFSSPNFAKLAEAYDIQYTCIRDESEIELLDEILNSNSPAFIEVQIFEKTYVFPKLEFGTPNQDQEPLLDRRLYDKLMEYGEENDMDSIKTEHKFGGEIVRKLN